jgi:hypothetical protein
MPGADGKKADGVLGGQVDANSLQLVLDRWIADALSALTADERCSGRGKAAALPETEQ